MILRLGKMGTQIMCRAGCYNSNTRDSELQRSSWLNLLSTIDMTRLVSHELGVIRDKVGIPTQLYWRYPRGVVIAVEWNCHMPVG